VNPFDLRVRTVNSAAVRDDGSYVLYWMIAARRTTWNFSLQRAAQWAASLDKPLIVFEPLRIGYPWASERLHRFVIDGMADNERRLAKTKVAYYPYVEPRPDADKGLLAALASQASVIVTDHFPCFFLPRMVSAAAAPLDVRVESVDGNGILPLGATDQVFVTAYQFRRYLQKSLAPHLSQPPLADPLGGLNLRKASVPADILRRWPAADLKALLTTNALKELPIDHTVEISPIVGGPQAAAAALDRFLVERLSSYVVDRNEPDREGASGLSPYLHFGHISPHEVLHRIAEQARWSPEKLSKKAAGKRAGWWGMSEGAEAFLDQLITWRELGFNFCEYRDDYDRFESLPEFALKTLEKHTHDRRPVVYTPEQFANAATHDPLWNAAQRQLVREGRLHNYLRMLWGKKILEWTASPREALDVMIELNNRFALDGRDPNSYSGIFWTLGRYDRAWGPERFIFGTVRYMSSENTARKLSVDGYLEKYGS